MDHFDQFLASICAGAGLFLAGAANLLLVRKAVVVRALATVVAVGIALAAASAIDRPGTVVNAAKILVVGLAVFALLGSRRLLSGLVKALTVGSRPVVRCALLTAAGIGLTVGSVVVCERADRAATDEAMGDLELFESRVQSVPIEGESVYTDRGSRIPLRQPANPRGNDHLFALEDRYLLSARLKEEVIRHGQPDERTNCHGWVFAEGKFLVASEDVNLILRDNQYVEASQPQPGDLVVYRANGAITHSAIVRYVTDGQPVLVQSKWGALGVFLHPISQSPYGTGFTFYRSPRRGHLLARVPPSDHDSHHPMVGE